MRTAQLSTAPFLAALTLTASCVGPPANAPVVQRPARLPPSPPITIQPTPAPVPTLPTDWRDWPVTQGDWRYAPTAGGGMATFGPAGAPLFAMVCDRASRRVLLERMRPVAEPLTIRTTTVTRTMVTTLAGTPAVAVAPLPANDALLDAMGFSRGRFAADQPGAPPIVMPAYAEVERVVQGCRE